MKRGNSLALLKRGYITQALIDSTALLFIFLFLLMTAASLPLALFMMIFCTF